ncbi:MAG: alpha/beta fold hydrolase [Chloroflexota bacterium]
MPDATVNGLRIHYQRQGSGPPLVLLHGIGTDGRCWYFQLAGLSAHYTVIAWDMRGYGGSDDPPGPYTFADVASDLAGLLDVFGFQRAYICGQSMGGVVAQEFAGRYPERVSALILGDSLAGHGALPPEERARRLEARIRASADPAAMAKVRAPQALSPSAAPELVAQVEALMAQVHVGGYRLAARALSESDERPLLPGIAAPTLILWGEHDTVCPRAESEELLGGIPGARMDVISGAGHMSNQERPEAFNQAVRIFLSGLPRAAGGGSGDAVNGDGVV